MNAPSEAIAVPRSAIGTARDPGPIGNSPLPIRSAVFASGAEDRALLCRLLLLHPCIEVVATPASLAEAQALVGRDDVRLLFCDLSEAPQQTLAWLAERPSPLDVILAAADESLAAKAFEVDALDFFVKPLSKERLSRSIRRLLRLDWSGGGREIETRHRVFIPFERGRRLISTDEICAVSAIGNYTQVRLAGGATEIVMRPLRRWEETLPAGSFLRIHRSTLVNAKRLRRLDQSPEGEGALAEVDGLPEKLIVSRRCLASVRGALAGGRV